MSDGGEKPNVGTSGHLDYMCSGGIPKDQMTVMAAVDRGTTAGTPISVRVVPQDGDVKVVIDEYEFLCEDVYYGDVIPLGASYEAEEEEPRPEPYYERFRNNGRNKRRRY